MKRIAAYVTSSLLTFTFGIWASALLPWNQYATEVPFRDQTLIFQIARPAPQVEAKPTPEPEVVFGSRGLKLVPEEVHLTSERFHYEINVTYPQVAGSDDVQIRQLNQRIKDLVTARYQWPLTITAEELRRSLELHPEPTNTVDIVYEVSLATDSVLSIYFGEYSYRIGAAHAVQKSFVVNYDLASRKELKLSDLFAPGSKYLQFISRYCKNEFKRDGGLSVFPEALAPESRNFESWNVTPVGIGFNFDQCTIVGCSGGQQSVEIPFSDLKPMLSARGMSILPISSVVKVKADH